MSKMFEEKRGVKCSADSLSHRIARSSITYEEMIDIADVLGYDIQFVKRS